MEGRGVGEGGGEGRKVIGILIASNTKVIGKSLGKRGGEGRAEVGRGGKSLGCRKQHYNIGN